MIIAGLAPAVAKAATPVINVPGLLEIPMGDEGGRPVVDVTINGKGPYPFILDTGASVTVISDNLQAELGLAVQAKGSGAGPEQMGRSVTVDLGVAGASLKGVTAAVLPLPSLGDARPPRGVLSASSFPGYLLTLDYPAHKIRIAQGELPAADDRRVFAYTQEQVLPTVPITVGVIKVRAHVDSGSPGALTLPTQYMKQIPLASTPTIVGRAMTPAGEFQVWSAQPKGSVTLGAFALKLSDIRFSDISPIPGSPTGNIGYRVLKDFAVTLDAKNLRIQLESLPSVSGASVVASTQPSANAASIIPDTVSGHRVAAYVAAFNAGADAMSSWTQTNMASSALAARSPGDRAAMYQRMRADMQTLTPVRLVSSASDRIEVAMKTGAGEPTTFEFRFDGTADELVTGIRVQIGGPAEQGPGPQSTARLRSDAELKRKLDGYLNGAHQADAFSGVVEVFRGDQAVYTRAIGLANKARAMPNTVETSFNVGSINKLMTQIAIEQLVEQGKIKYSDTLGTLLPDYPNDDAKRITVRQLVDMTSGIGDFFGPEFVAAQKDRIRSLKDYLPFFASKPLKFAPGTGRVYSNGGYIVLGLVIERIAGMSYYDYAARHILEPAGMTRSGWFSRKSLPAYAAIGYTKRGDSADTTTWHENAAMLPGRGSSAGGGYASAGDLKRLALALKNGKLLTPEGTAAIVGGGLSDAGGSPGCNAELDIDPQSGYTVVVLSNYDPRSAERVGAQIRAWLGL